MSRAVTATIRVSPLRSMAAAWARVSRLIDPAPRPIPTAPVIRLALPPPRTTRNLRWFRDPY